MAGYSGTALVKKLGLKPPINVLLLGAPAEYPSWLGPVAAGITFVPSTRRAIDAAHVFVSTRAALQKQLPKLRQQLAPTGFVWVSWPKKSSGVASDVTEDTIREVALPLGLVDVKVCAVSDVWSGLKLVIRKEQRR